MRGNERVDIHVGPVMSGLVFQCAAMLSWEETFKLLMAMNEMH
jgi:hypothetical protein